MHIKKTTCKTTVLARALAIAFGGVIAVATPAFGQSNATGTIFGQVGETAGATIVLENSATGARRTVSPDANGRYQATSMPPGRYKVQLLQGAAVQQSLEIEALVGQGIEASFVSGSGVQAVKVVGKASRIDVSNTNNGAVFTSKELSKLPISNNVAAVIMLAPGTVKNVNSAYGNVASFGGASVSENAYYINGFPVTNILTQVGSSELPFGAIANAQVLSGGYSAEFGRATGGVVNITTKSGTNNWEVGAKVSIAPDSLRAAPLDVYFPNTGVNPDTDGKLQYRNRDNKSTSKTYGLYVGGPLIKDKLFMFVAAEQTPTNSDSVVASTDKVVNPAGFSESRSKSTRTLAKLDYNLTDNHHFELTHIFDELRTTTTSYGYNHGTNTRDFVKSGQTTYVNCCANSGQPGANDLIAKYTGFIGENLTLTALYGRSTTKHSRTPEGYDPSLRQTTSSVTSRVPGVTYPSPQLVTGSLPAPESGDDQKTLRIDVEYKLGAHSLRGGIDHNKVASVVGSSLAGGGTWAYRFNKDPNYKPFGSFESLAQGGGYGAKGFYVSEDYRNNVAHPTSTQSAQYLQDRYQVTENILLDLGLRDEQFTNNNSANQPIIAQRHQVAPRLGATWDVNHDSSLKVFANAGRYFLQVPTNLSSNFAGVSLSTSKYYTYTGVDATTGAPTGLHAISDATSVNNSWGQSTNPATITAINIKPLYQDEVSLGFEKTYSPTLNFGVMGTYRVLRSSNDDLCDQRPFDAWGVKNNVDMSDFAFPCAIINPGEANSFMMDLHGDGKLTRIDLSAADIGLPKARRSYAALNAFVEHPLRNGWYGKINYTYSKSRGNAEGQTDSLQGGDAALTVSWDHKELMYNAYGYLSSDRTHVFKAFGFYQPTVEWTVTKSSLSGETI